MARRFWLLAIAIGVVLSIAAPKVALAWGSGGGSASGPGTHQWILRTANGFARQQGALWLDAAVAASATVEPASDPADDPNHDFDHWGAWHGSANTRVASLYDDAVGAYRAGDRIAASRDVGLLAHYYADVCDPLHTDESATEPSIAPRFELAVDWLLSDPRTGSWATYDGYQRVTDPSAATISAATIAHHSYAALVSGLSANGFDASVNSIAKDGVGRAANGVADMIMSIQQAAIEVSSSPNVSSHQGVAAGGGYYYVIHTTNVTRYDQSWNATGTIDHPVGWWTGFIQPHLGDGCYFDGKLYVVAENYPIVSFQQVIVYDAATLRYIRRFWTNQPHEVSSITVADLGDRQPVLVISSYNDSTRLFKYSIDDGSYLGSIPLQPTPRAGIQGITFQNGRLYIGACRGFGTGYLYSATPDGHTKLLYTRQSPAYQEGLDTDGDDLLWLADRGTDSRVNSLKLPDFMYSLP